MSDVFLTVNGLKLDREGFCTAVDLTDLKTKGPRRGTDFVAQGVAGETFRPKVRGALRALIPLEVQGLVSSAGVARTSTAWAGIRDNLEEIETTCVTGSESALVTVTVTYEDATTRSGQGYCPRLDAGLYRNDLTGVLATAVLEIVIPAGQLT